MRRDTPEQRRRFACAAPRMGLRSAPNILCYTGVVYPQVVTQDVHRSTGECAEGTPGRKGTNGALPVLPAPRPPGGRPPCPRRGGGPPPPPRLPALWPSLHHGRDGGAVGGQALRGERAVQPGQ